ncbi:MAG: FAD-binding protein [Actinomycetales bacterium]|nr:FAD-binding protein [Actinomycetales bacterium]
MALANWAGNVTFTPDRLVSPTSVDELCGVVASASRVRALGTGHSFSAVADSADVLVSVAGLPRVVDVDPAAATARVSAGLRWGEIAPDLQASGLAVHTLGSLPHISVAGSVATGTHGSGDRNGCLATAVTALELVSVGGERRTVRRGDEGFDGSVVALGALGVVTHVTLALVPSYDVDQTVLEDLPLDAALEHLDTVLGSAMSVSLFTTWRGRGFEQVWIKHRVGDPDVDLSWTGATRADGPRHPVPGADPVHCTTQGGVVGAWFERVPHFRLDFTPSSGAELQTEYLVPREHGAAALRAVDAVRDLVAPVLQVSEIRSVAADGLWLSPAYGRDSLAIHFTWVADTARVLPVVAAVEDSLAPFDPRPHWGKVFATDPARVAESYPRMDDARRLLLEHDPDGVLRNDFVDRHLLIAP